jgi:hypothetical protein
MKSRKMRRQMRRIRRKTNRKRGGKAPTPQPEPTPVPYPTPVKLQLFVYKIQQLDGTSRHPSLTFENVYQRDYFIRRLVSRQARQLDEPYFVINNPQELPAIVRREHMHIDEEREERDNCFSISENLDILRRFINAINNNTRSNYGFTNALVPIQS